MPRNPKPNALDQPLPATVATGSNRWWLSYRNFPVFSAEWLLRRFGLFSVFIILWGCLSGLNFVARGGSTGDALRMFGYFLAGVMVIVHGGPALATLVRHRSLRPRLEKQLVVGALVAGLGIAFVADMWSSAHIARLAGLTAEVEFPASLTLVNIIVLLAIYGVLGGGLALRAYLTEGRRLAKFEHGQAMEELRRQKRASERRLERLQAQVEPHLLFNTLGTVRSSIREDPDHAEATLDALCDYLRATIPRLRAGEEQSRLGEQLDVCKYYLQVMKMRMRDRLNFSIEVEDALRNHPFPPFILLSLVENAVKHGLEPRTEGGRIDLRARVEDGLLVVEVNDDGMGLGTSTGGGVGLRNIREQLRLRHGDKASVSLEGRPSGGVRARLRLPVEQP